MRVLKYPCSVSIDEGNRFIPKGHLMLNTHRNRQVIQEKHPVQMSSSRNWS